MMKTYRLTIYAVLLSAGLYGCTSSDSVSFRRNVEIVYPQGQNSIREYHFPGVVQESQEISLGFKTAGQIAGIYVKEGDYVAKGKLIAVLDKSDYRLGVDAARLQYEQMEREVARLKQLFDSKSISGNDYDKAVSGLKQLKVQLEAKENQLSYTELRAPVSGYVQSVNFHVSEMVDAGTPFVEILDVSRMEIAVDVPVSFYQQRNQLSGFSCISDYGGNAPEELTLISITPKADNNQLYRMLLGFKDAPDASLTAGMNVAVTVGASVMADSGMVRLPMHAVFEDGGKSFVWIVTPDTVVVKRQVDVAGIDENGCVKIRSGVKVTDRVVRSGVNCLQEKEQVKILDKPSETNVGGLI